MMHIEEYCSTNKISRRQVERLLSTSQIPSEKINGQRYIITPPEIRGPVTNSHLSPEKFKEEIRTFVDKCGKLYIKTALNRIAEYERATGHKICGLSGRTLYGIAEGKRSVFHKKRKDTGTSRNPNLAAVKEKIEAMAGKLYMTLGEKNMRFVTTRLQEQARDNESLYEIAAIPQSTLYRYVRNYLGQYDSVWDYANNHKAFQKSLMKVQGAFTDSIEFMDYIAFDDRKADVAGSWYYNEAKAKWELRKVWYWIAIEMLTMMPVGWVILPREPNSEDVINVLVQSMLKVGLPNKGYLFDNGIGNSERVQNFMIRIKQECTGSGHFEQDFIPVAPYEPTHKSNIELFNRHIKKELDVWYKNYVGGSREEVRNSGKRLMPEECDHIVEEYISKADAYLTGDCVNRERRKVIKSKMYKTSTNDLFEKFWNKYTGWFPDEKTIRWALMDETQIKTYNGKISLNRSGVRFDYQPADYCPALEGRKFILAILPTNLAKIDLYATEDFVDTVTGESFERGKYVTTLFSTRDLPSSERQQLVFKSNTQKKNLAKKLKEKLLETALLQFPDLIPIVNTYITINGEALDMRKQLLARMNSINENTPLNSIAEFIRHEVEVISGGTELTYDGIDEDIFAMKLTVEGEEI
jgi:hypothetical protein